MFSVDKNLKWRTYLDDTQMKHAGDLGLVKDGVMLSPSMVVLGMPGGQQTPATYAGNKFACHTSHFVHSLSQGI